MTFVIVEVKKLEDVGKNEIRRLLVDKIQMSDVSLVSKWVACVATEVHPTTANG